MTGDDLDVSPRDAGCCSDDAADRLVRLPALGDGTHGDPQCLAPHADDGIASGTGDCPDPDANASWDLGDPGRRDGVSDYGWSRESLVHDS